MQLVDVLMVRNLINFLIIPYGRLTIIKNNNDSALKGKDEKAMARALLHLRILMQTSTTSMTSVPKPLKFLRDYYARLKDAYYKIEKNDDIKRQFAEILSVLVIVGTSPGSRECLDFCIKGSVKNPGEWGHEYVRQLEAEIVDEWTSAPIKEEEDIRSDNKE